MNAPVRKDLNISDDDELSRIKLHAPLERRSMTTVNRQPRITALATTSAHEQLCTSPAWFSLILPVRFSALILILLAAPHSPPPLRVPNCLP